MPDTSTKAALERGLYSLGGGIAAGLLFTFCVVRLVDDVDGDMLYNASLLVGTLLGLGVWAYQEDYIYRLVTGQGRPLPLRRVVAYLEQRLAVTFRDIDEFHQSSGIGDRQLKLADGTALKPDLTSWEAFSVANRCLANLGRDVAVRTKAPESDLSPAPEVESKLRELVTRFETLVDDKQSLCRAIPQLFDGLLEDELEPLLDRCPATLRKGVVDVVLQHYGLAGLAAWCHDCLHDARLVGFDCNGYFTPVSSVHKLLTEKLAVGETTEMWVASAREFLSGAGFVLWCGRFDEACEELEGPGSERLKRYARRECWAMAVIVFTDFSEHNDEVEADIFLRPSWKLPSTSTCEQLEVYRQLRARASLPEEEWDAVQLTVTAEPFRMTPVEELTEEQLEGDEASAVKASA